MTKQRLKRALINFFHRFDGEGSKLIKTKFNNICGKTGRYDVPTELFQKRTSRKNRVLLPWKSVKKNNLTLAQLETFYNGVVIEFVNNEYFEEDTNELARILKSRLGSDEIVSSMISIRTEEGNPSSTIQREAFNKLKKAFPNYKDLLIRRKTPYSGSGNSSWEGFIYYSIRGGQQDITLSHPKSSPQLFNPACAYANEDVCLDIDLVMIYYALFSIDKDSLSSTDSNTYETLKKELENNLKEINYDEGNLLEYCQKHPCLSFFPNKMIDPIQVRKIKIQDFAIKDGMERLDLTHNEAVNKGRFYFDSHKKCILSSARPTNLFWSKHLSNMMQQDFSLYEFFDFEKELVAKREKLLK